MNYESLENYAVTQVQKKKKSLPRILKCGTGREYSQLSLMFLFLFVLFFGRNTKHSKIALNVTLRIHGSYIFTQYAPYNMNLCLSL